MKKYGKFFKKAALTAAICLGLSQSVWAMPTGGAVAEGTVSGFAANPASGAEFTVTGGPAIINWGAFGIAANESMSFNTAGGALLNQVTGGNMSQILGTLTQTGANPMFLVNPAGIVVGPGATINANQLVLSALAIDNQDFLSGNYNFAAADGKAGTLQILGNDKEKTTINVSGISSEYFTPGYFVGLGKTVEVADGVTFSCADEQNYPNIDFWQLSGVQLAAANGFGGSLGYESGVTTNKNNTLSFSGTANTFGQFNLQGGSVAVENANVTAAYFNAKAYSGSPYGARSFAGGVSLTDSTIKATEDAAIMGSTVDFDSTTISGMSADALIVAAKSATQNYVYDEATGTSNETQTYTMASGNKVTANNLTISGVLGAANIYGGSVALTDSTIDVAPSHVKHDSSIRALPGLVLTGYYDVQPDFSSVTGAEKASDYKVELTNTKVTMTVKNNEIDPSIDISGGAVKLDKGTTVTLTGGDDNGINIYAVGGQSGETMTATADNLVEVANGSKLDSRGQRIEVTAGKIAVQDGSEISGKNTYLVANDKIGFQYVEALKNTMPYGVGTKGDIAVSTDSTIPADAVIDGNKTVIDNGGGNVEPDPEPVVVDTDLPTGGKLASGGVTVNNANWTAGDLGNNSTVATKSNSVIDWSTFSIGTGKALTFNTDGGALLNRVPNGPISNIYGTLTQTGKYPLLLVNPAGVLVGKGATIDANALLLSTLTMTNDGFKDAMEHDKLVLGGKGTNPGPLTIQTGANVKASDHLGLYGGTVTVADGVNFNLGSELSMVAAQRFSAMIGNTAENSDYCIGAEGFRPNGIDASSSNLLSMGKNELTPNKFALLNGGAVKLQNTTIDSGVVEVRAAASGSQQGKDFVFTMGADNAISIAKATLTGNELDVIGGKVNIEGSHLTQTMVGTGSDLDIAALGEYTAFDGGDASNQPLDASHTLMLKDTTVEFKGNTKAEDKYIFMGAGQIALDNTKVTSNNGIRISSGKVFGNEGGTADEKNTLTIANGSNVEADTWMEVMGGSIAVTGSDMSAGKDLHVAAFKTATMSATAKGNGGTNEGGAVTGGTAGDGNTVTLSGAKIDAQSIQIFGGKVDITDGSAITETNTANKNDLTIMAAPGFVSPEGEDGLDPDFSNPSGAASSYAVTVKDSSVTLNTSGSTGDPSIDIGAGKVTLDNAKVTLTGGDDNGIEIFAISGMDGRDLTATTSNSITLKNGTIVDSQGERLALVAGKIAIGDESEVSAKNDANGALRVIASDKIGWEETGLSTDVPVMKGSQNTIAVSEDSKILNNGVDVTDQIATTRSLIDPTNPAAPEEAATQQENIDAGKEVMDAALSNDTPAERASATENLVNNINSSTASDAAKAAQITGVMQEILTSDLSDSEKVALQREVIYTFTPTKVATDQASNVVTSATQQAGDAQPQQTQQQSVAVNAGSTAAVPTAAEVNDTPVSIGGTDNQGGAEE